MPAAALRSSLKRFPALRSTYYLGQVLRQLAFDEWKLPGVFDSIFLDQPDPWSSNHPLEHQRVGITLALLDHAAPSGFDAAIEIGCAEGIFTEIVAPRCRELVAADYSPVALDRARGRLQGVGNVQFSRLDLRTDAIAGKFDLVLAMGVLTYFVRPWDVRKAADKLIDALKPGGVLLFSDARQSRVFENAWWGRAMLRGGKQIRAMLERHPQLVLESLADTDAHVFAVYRRRDGDATNRSAVLRVPVPPLEATHDA